LRPQESLAGYCVAYRIAQKARIAAARRRKHEAATAGRMANPSHDGADPSAHISLREAQQMLDDQLARLPDKFRVPLVLCYLQGLTQDEAAQQLGWRLSTLKSRLEQARDRLGRRLTSRGLTLSAALVASLFNRPGCCRFHAGRAVRCDRQGGHRIVRRSGVPCFRTRPWGIESHAGIEAEAACGHAGECHPPVAHSVQT
jgi:hypothetical protein